MKKTKKVNEYRESLINDFPFCILNKNAEYFSGFKHGKPCWSDNFKDARIFERDEQYKFLAFHEIYHKPEKFYLV